MPDARQVYHKRELEKGFYYAQAVRAGTTPVRLGVRQLGLLRPRHRRRRHAGPGRCGLPRPEGDAGRAWRDVATCREGDRLHDGHGALEEHNAPRIKWYVDDGSAPPASTWIGCTCLALPGLMLEVECVAVPG